MQTVIDEAMTVERAGDFGLSVLAVLIALGAAALIVSAVLCKGEAVFWWARQRMTPSWHDDEADLN